MHFGELFNMDDLIMDSSYAIFDDIDWKWFPGRKGWLGAQKHFTVTDKYRHKRAVTWGKPCIWLTNKPLRDHEGMTLNDEEWIHANCIVVTLTRELDHQITLMNRSA